MRGMRNGRREVIYLDLHLEPFPSLLDLRRLPFLQLLQHHRQLLRLHAPGVEVPLLALALRVLLLVVVGGGDVERLRLRVAAAGGGGRLLFGAIVF
jgi:hypothetical protein